MRRQHGVVSRRQLLDHGIGVRGIEHRLATGRLHLLVRGVYAVGRPEIDRDGRWMALILASGTGAVLSHRSAAALWGVLPDIRNRTDISVPFASHHHPRHVRVHRRYGLRPDDLAERRGLPVTSPVRTLLDIASEGNEERLERAVNEADRLDLVNPEGLRAALGAYRGERGVRQLRTLLDRQTFRLTDSGLERRFLALVDSIDMERPQTQVTLNGFRVDFYWPDLGLVVETDGLRYHRTPAQQARDKVRDQAHAAAGMTPLRFTHEQIRHQAPYVRRTLAAVARRRGWLPSQ